MQTTNGQGNNNIKKCRDCVFSVKVPTNVVGVWVGECRRFPPLLLVINAEVGQCLAKWPVVQGDNNFYCFEFQDRAAAGITPDEIVKYRGPWPSLDRLEESIKNLQRQIDEYLEP